ncbi:MAG TPA: response regulator [Spirochaetota bacterium]|nr:response regulator [Spirochaetota bacterium]
MPKVLIVDDKEQNLFVLRNFFKLFFKNSIIELFEAKNSIDAIRMIKEHKPDLVLLDIRLETEDAGLKVAEEIRNTPEVKETVIWALTAQAIKSRDSDIGDREKCLQAGCNDYFPKPFDQIELVNKIGAQLGIKIDVKIN